MRTNLKDRIARVLFGIEDGILEAVTATAMKRVLVWQITQATQKPGLK